MTETKKHIPHEWEIADIDDDGVVLLVNLRTGEETRLLGGDPVTKRLRDLPVGAVVGLSEPEPLDPSKVPPEGL